MQQMKQAHDDRQARIEEDKKKEEAVGRLQKDLATQRELITKQQPPRNALREEIIKQANILNKTTEEDNKFGTLQLQYLEASTRLFEIRETIKIIKKELETQQGSYIDNKIDETPQETALGTLIQQSMDNQDVDKKGDLEPSTSTDTPKIDGNTQNKNEDNTKADQKNSEKKEVSDNM